MPERSCPSRITRIRERDNPPEFQLKEGGHMNKKLMVLGAVLGVATLGWSETNKEEASDRLDNAAKVLHEVMAAPDKGIPSEVLDHAKCVAVVPHMVKGRIRGRRRRWQGRGNVPHGTWMERPGVLHSGRRKLGLQIGVEGIDLVMVVQNEQGMQHLLTSKFKLGADASAAAGPVGRHASAEHGLEDGCGDPDLLAGQGCIRRANAQRRRGED